MKQRFSTKLIARGPRGSWIFLVAPFSVEAVFGSKARVPVRGTINGFAFRTSLIPEGDGTHYMAVNKAMQEGAGATAGDTVSVEMDVDRAERTVDVPEDLERALKKRAAVRAAFASLSYSHKKEYVDWITGAKKAETRAHRIEKAVGMLETGKTPKQ